MLDGRPVIDVHLHPARKSSLTMDWATWVHDFDSPDIRDVYRDDGTVDVAHFAANLNPHLHHRRALYPAYAMLQERGCHWSCTAARRRSPARSTITATPPSSTTCCDFRRLHIVLAHGGRGRRYDAAAFLALANEHVWIELSGLPPSRLQTYYARHSWARLTRKMIFGTDWPGIPGIAANARPLAALCPDDETADLVLAGNAQRVYGLAALEG